MIILVFIYIICDFFFVVYKGNPKSKYDNTLKGFYFVYLTIALVSFTFVSETSKLGITGLLLIQIYQEYKEKILGRNLEEKYHEKMDNFKKNMLRIKSFLLNAVKFIGLAIMILSIILLSSAIIIVARILTFGLN